MSAVPQQQPIDEDDEIGNDYRPNRAQRRAMGYTRRRKVFVLKFEDPELEGLEVRARTVPLGTFLDLVELAETAGMGEDFSAGDVGADELKAIRSLFTGFAEALVSWNLEDDVLGPDGEPTGDTVPVPADADGLLAQDMEFGLQIVGAWMSAVAGVADPLAQRSSGGARSLEASLPMEPSSPSPPS